MKHPIEEVITQHHELFCFFLDVGCSSAIYSSDHLKQMQLLSAKLKYQSRHNSFLFCDKFKMLSSAHRHVTSAGFDHSLSEELFKVSQIFKQNKNCVFLHILEIGICQIHPFVIFFV